MLNPIEATVLERRTGLTLLHAVAFKVRGLVMAPAMALLALCTKWEIENGWVVWGIGLVFLLAGVAGRLWAQRYLRYRVAGQRALAVAGPYRFVRNPVYLANIVLLTGMCVLCELLWAIPLGVAWAGLIYGLAVRFEETRLRKRYGGDYERYAHEVPRWIPKLSAPPHAAAQVASWWAAAGAEWHCLVLLMLPAIKEIVTHAA